MLSSNYQATPNGQTHPELSLQVSQEIVPIYGFYNAGHYHKRVTLYITTHYDVKALHLLFSSSVPIIIPSLKHVCLN